MTDEERILDLLLAKTREGRVTWSYRPLPSIPGVGPLPGLVWEEVYAARIKTDTGELLAILRVPGADPRWALLRVARSLSVRNLTDGTEVLVEADRRTQSRFDALLEMVRSARPSWSIIKELEKV